MSNTKNEIFYESSAEHCFQDGISPFFVAVQWISNAYGPVSSGNHLYKQFVNNNIKEIMHPNTLDSC
jgi:hypothetical protein